MKYFDWDQFIILHSCWEEKKNLKLKYNFKVT